jgi:hypothetical protein
MGAPMPPEIRAAFGRSADPVLMVSCDHCEAGAGAPCRLRLSGRRLPRAHPSRRDKAARLSDVQPDRKEA